MTRAAVLRDFNGSLAIENVQIQDPRPEEVLVDIVDCAICHSDIHLIRGEWGGEAPLIPGHEASGRVVAVGSAVHGYQAGDRVVVTLMRACRRCERCLLGDANNCLYPPEPAPIYDACGVPIIAGFRTAAFAERTNVHVSQIAPIDDAISFAHASLLACGGITGTGAVFNTAALPARSTCAVVGAGGVGLNVIQAARISGCNKIIAIDKVPQKLSVAEQLGATDTLLADEDDPVEHVLKKTGGGADFAFASVGYRPAIESCMRMIHTAGTAIVVGMPPNDGSALTVNSHELTTGRTLKGSNMGGTKLLPDIKRLLSLYHQKRLQLEPIISHRFSFDRINEAMDLMSNGLTLRVVVHIQD